MVKIRPSSSTPNRDPSSSANNNNNTLQNDNRVVSRHKYKKLKKELKELLKLNKSLIQIIAANNTATNNRVNRNTKNLNHNRFGPSSSFAGQEELCDNTSSDMDDVLQRFSRNFSQPQLSPPPSPRMNSVVPKRNKYQLVDRDETGKPVMPQQISVFRILSLGKVKIHPDTYHSKAYVYAVGFSSQRIFDSMVDPNHKTLYTSTILEGNDGRPIFQITAADQSENPPITATTPDKAWEIVIKQSRDIRGITKIMNKVQGAQHYGLFTPTIAHLMQELPGVGRLKNYRWKEFEKMDDTVSGQVKKCTDIMWKKDLENIQGETTTRREEQPTEEDNVRSVDNNDFVNHDDAHDYNSTSNNIQQRASSSLPPLVTIFDSDEEDFIKQEQEEDYC